MRLARPFDEGSDFLTRFEGGSYTFKVIRPFLAIGIVALSSCALDSASRNEFVELNSQVRSVRAENARMQVRLEQLEQQLAVSASRSTGAGAVVKPGASQVKTAAALVEQNDLPSLTVVKLKPKKETPPKINTRVEVVEPSEAYVADFKEAPLFTDKDVARLSSPGSTSPGPSGAPADEMQEQVADEQYDQGVAALKTGNIEGAIKTLTSFSHEWPKHPRADNALYFAGVGQMALKEFENAEKTFHDALTKYPAGDTVLDSMLKLAECRYKLKRPNDARATWEKIVTTFPGTAAATAAQQRLASLSAGKPASPE